MSKRYVLGESAARRLAQMLRGKGEVSSRSGAAAGITVDSEYVAPFTVQWAQSVGDAGAWIIWLPSAELVTLPGGVTIDPAESLTAAGGDYPSGWYVVPAAALSASEGGTLYLNITLGDSPSAAFSNDAAADADDKIDVPVCDAAVNATTGERRVVQLLTSVIALGGEGGGEPPVDEKSVDWREDEVEGDESLPGVGDETAAATAKSLEIKGWKDQESTAETLADALGLNDKKEDEGGGDDYGGVGAPVEDGGDSGGDAGTERQVLVRNGPDGALEYMPLGKIKGDGGDEDEDEDDSDVDCAHDANGVGGGVNPTDDHGRGGTDPTGGSSGGIHGGGSISGGTNGCDC